MVGYRGGELKRELPYDVWDKLSPRGKHICRYVVAEKGQGVTVEWQPDWKERPGGGGGNAKHTGAVVAKI